MHRRSDLVGSSYVDSDGVKKRQFDEMVAWEKRELEKERDCERWREGERSETQCAQCTVRLIAGALTADHP